MKRAALLVILALCASCEVAKAPPSLDLGVGQAHLAVTDASLLAPLKSFIALMYFNPGGENACPDLVDAPLSALAAREPLASQVIPLEGDNRSNEHAFGNVAESGVHSFLLLGSLKPKGLLRFEVDDAGETSDPLVEGEGSVIAVGCEEIDVRQYQRFDLPISLFPAGLL